MRYRAPIVLAGIAVAGALVVDVTGGPGSARTALLVIAAGIAAPIVAVVLFRRWPGEPPRTPVAALEAPDPLDAQAQLTAAVLRAMGAHGAAGMVLDTTAAITRRPPSPRPPHKLPDASALPR